MVVWISLLCECSLCFGCRVSIVHRPQNNTSLLVIWNCLIILSILNNFTNIVGWVIVCCDVCESSLRTKNKLRFLHLRFQLCSINSACVGSELLVSLSWVRLINRSLVKTSKLEIALSQARTRCSWCICNNLSVLSWAAAFVCALETLCTLRSCCNPTVWYVYITRRNRNFFHDFYWCRLCCDLLHKAIICTKLEMCLSEFLSVLLPFSVGSLRKWNVVLNKVLLSRRRIFNLILPILKLDCTRLKDTFLLLIFEFLNKGRLIVVFQLLRKVSLYLLSCCRIVKFVTTDVEVGLSQVRCIRGFVRDRLSILAVKCSTCRCLLSESSIALTNRKVSSSGWLSQRFAVTLLVIRFKTYNACEVFLSRSFGFELLCSLWQTSDWKVCSSRLALFGSPLLLWLVDSGHLRLASEGSLFAFQVFLLQQHHF